MFTRRFGKRNKFNTRKAGGTRVMKNRIWNIVVGFLVLLLVGAPLVQAAPPTEAATYTVNTVVDENDGSCGDGDCSLRDAIIETNNNPGPDTINFNISGCGGVCTIHPISELPIITDDGTTIDGYSQPGTAQATATTPATLLIEVAGTDVSEWTGFAIRSSGNSIKGLVINHFSYPLPGGGTVAGAGISIDGNNNTISGNYIGTDASGTVFILSGSYGIYINAGARNNVIGGDTPAERNVISGCEWGIEIDGESNIISGNYIGPDASGTAALGATGDGIYLAGNQNVIGGDTPGERNVISGNPSFGISIWHGDGNVITGNYIGTDADGTAALGNGWDGVAILQAVQNNTIGPGNIIAHNGGDGVVVSWSEATGNIITQNSIFSNDQIGIDLVDGANGDIPAPVIAATTGSGPVSITGTACPGCTVEVFENSDDDGEGETYIGSGVADGNGNFTVTVSSQSKPYLTATATDVISGTSEFSPVFPYSISGVITDIDDSPIPGVVVSTDTGASAVTSPDGSYSIDGLPGGIYIVTASAEGLDFEPDEYFVYVPSDEEEPEDLSALASGKSGRNFKGWKSAKLVTPFAHAGESARKALTTHIYSYFDHKYPLGGETPAGVLRYDGKNKSQTKNGYCIGGKSCYSGHNGYDFSFGLPAGTAVYAAMNGTATAHRQYCGPGCKCQDHRDKNHRVPMYSVTIDYGNYRTIYLHLKNDATWKKLWNKPGHTDPEVKAGERIGSIGQSGAPYCATGSHLHFGAQYDFNHNGMFETDELVDPYGWWASKQFPIDPWTKTFEYEGKTHTGTPSHWLWKYNWKKMVGFCKKVGVTFTTDGIAVKLSVPRAAVSDDGFVFVFPAASKGMLIPPLGGTQAMAADPIDAGGHTFELSGFYEDETPIDTFLEPVEITVTYDDEDVTYVDEVTLQIYWLDESDEENEVWVPLTTALDTDANTATVETELLGFFSLRGMPINSAPSVVSVNPNSAGNNVETEIAVTGANFLDGAWVELAPSYGSFGGASLATTFVSTTELQAVVPTGLLGGTYDVIVTNPDDQTAALTSAFTVVDVPMIVTGVSPNSGRNDAETPITVTGANFLDGAWVYVGETELATTFISNTTLTATVPAGLTPGTYDVAVDNPDGRSAMLTDGFTVTEPPTGGIYLPIILKNHP